MKKINLSNGITVILKENKNTPRTAITFYLSLEEGEKISGTFDILNRLFLQGTKTRTAEQLSKETDENAIEIYSEMKADYIRFKAVCLNEDVELMLDILQDIIQNSTLEDFSKEVIKIKGEIEAELESPKSKTYDYFYKNIYQNHPYGCTSSKIMEHIDEITKEDVRDAYTNILKNSKKIISVVGDFDEKAILNLLESHFATLKDNKNYECTIPIPELNEDKLICIEKDDAKQAQIIEGWLFPTYNTKQYATICILNSILGSSGLSSRLFLELREKQGLAYTVRSSYEPKRKCAIFCIYIGTEPKNIKTAVDGFKKEIDKIMTIPVSEKELEDAKNNVIGKRAFYTETNLLEASCLALYECQNLGHDYEEKLIEELKNVSSDDILRCSKEYFSKPKVLTVLAPKSCLDSVKNEIL